MQERAKQLAKDQWQNYVAPTISAHMKGQSLAYKASEVMAIAEHHYMSAAVHFYGHAVEDCGALAPLPGTDRYKAIHKDLEPAEVENLFEGWVENPISAHVEALDIRLPSINLACTWQQAYEKYQEECKEVQAAETVLHSLIELFDCIQAIQTCNEKGGNQHSLYTGLMCDMAERYRHGKPVLLARDAMLRKNAARWRYTDEVNAAILNGTWTP